ncbi:MAG: hypothetical protein GYA51_07660 [Candidatus Methanofastidiosa archaeon]|nr:hypothetical protein [Candidatus Methanofastidiosa archaeon]
MLSRKLKLTLNDVEVGNTPLLIPSFSSRVDMDVFNLIEALNESIKESILVSAYDIYYSDKLPEIFTELIFLDSGGYECAVDNNISELGYYRPEAHKWTLDNYLEVISKWPKDIPTVVISYDHPLERETIEEQVNKANELFNQTDNVLKEFLIKPEMADSNINLENLLENIDLLSSFDIIGVTEKELGNSIFDRMFTIAKIRQELDKKDIEIPLHIFGSLDTVTTPLYYFSGADIFDGLSWLRFTFQNGNTFYTDSHGPVKYDIHTNISTIELRNFADNITYLLRLKLDLEEFQSSENFDHFDKAKFFRESYRYLKTKIRMG